MMKIIRIYVYFAGVLLLITSLAKLVSSSGSARVLENTEPIFGMTFRHVFWLVGTIELLVALVCFFWKRVGLQAGLVAWLATSFLIYHLGLILISYHTPCSCMGNLTEALHISAKTADLAMKIILAFLFIGSYATLFWHWRQHRQVEGRIQNDEIKPTGSSEMEIGS
jgi:hypothetical protein